MPRWSSLPWLLLAACQCGDATPPPDPPASTEPERAAIVLPPADGCAREVTPLPADVHRGVCYAHNYQNGGERGYGSPTSLASHAELAELGVESVSLTPFAFMRGLDAERIELIEGYRAAETDERMEREIAACRGAGMRVVLKPHIWIRGGAYRGSIDMPDAAAWDRWWTSYRDFVMHYAGMAADNDVDVFVVGVELDHLAVRFEDRFRALVRDVRERFDGELTYSANWDKAVDLPIWDTVDYVGVQFYPPLADEVGATEAQMRERLAQYMDALQRLSERARRPVLFTEVGYRSAVGAEVRPHEWPERDLRPDVSHETQVLAFRLFFEAISGRDWVAGTYVWKWFTDPRADEEGPAGFSLRGKPAAAVLRAAYRGCDG
jgi:hypothetical protein